MIPLYSLRDNNVETINDFPIGFLTSPVLFQQMLLSVNVTKNYCVTRTFACMLISSRRFVNI